MAGMTGFDAVVRIARLALQSSGEGVESLHSFVDRTASMYGIGLLGDDHGGDGAVGSR
jgi:hypothetical protein